MGFTYSIGKRNRKGESYAMKKRKIFCSVKFVCILLFVLLGFDAQVLSAKEPYVIVIDPGHGGDNLGTSYLPTPEKYYNMTVALYMKERMEQYENVIVYMTHTEDIDMSLKERAEFAYSVQADFLFSLHFNQSIEHKIYGAEVWIPSEGILYSQGYGMAYEFMNEFEEMGLFNRGIKTRLGKEGDDYYGIIRHSALYDIPAIIVEHCHVDHLNDIPYLASEEKLQEFGYRNADAVARYFSLSMKDGSIDNSMYAPLAVPIPQERVSQDYTKPEYVVAELIAYDRFRKRGFFHISALEQESYLQHYAYSLDNGLTWSSFCEWTNGVNDMTVVVNMRESKTDHILFKVLNQYDNDRVSNRILLY